MAVTSHPSPAPAAPVTLWAERIGVCLGLALYLWVFSPDHPNGDGWVYIRGVEGGTVIWNPNHLYMQPTGLVFGKLTTALGLGLSTFATLKLLSAVAAMLAVLSFHGVLTRLWPAERATRLAGTLGLAFSAHFLSMSLAEEFFIIQLPVLCAVLALAVGWLTDRARWRLVASGVLLAVVTGIQINNAILAVLMGLWVGYESRAAGGRPIADILTVWLPGVVIGLPLLLVPYATSAQDQGLVAWLTSYQGKGNNSLAGLYGLQLTPVGIAKSLATLAYGFAVSLAGLGDLGTYGETLLTGRALEFEPIPLALAATGVLFACIGLGALLLLVWWWRRGRSLGLGRLGATWIASYLLFNFLWVDTSDQFWGPLLPGLWLMAIAASRHGRLARGGLAVVVALLALANTTSVAGHRAFVRAEEHRGELLRLLRPGDLVVTTGWDDLVWLSWGAGAPYERVALMDLALKGKPGEGPMTDLPARLRTHLASGRRVVVARVYDRDREARPWEQLAKLKWSRARVIQLLEPFAHKPLGQIGSVKLHELVLPRAPTGE
jgi:hypothetical protein